MSARGEDVTDDGQHGPFGSVGDEQDAMASFARHLSGRLISLGGNLTPTAQIQMELFNDEVRGRIVEEFVNSLAPSGVSPAVWLRWLSGGPGPFASGAIKRPAKLQQGAGKSIARGPASLTAKRDKVERARAELAQAERELEYGEALNKSLLQYAVTDHLVELLSGIFAMGPAWTIMRSLSSYLPEAVVEEETEFLSTKEKAMVLKPMTAERERASEKMFEVLDFFSGVAVFEEALRSAVGEVCKDFDGRRDELVKDGRRPRSKESLKTEVHPKAQHQAPEVLGGLKKPSRSKEMATSAG